LASIMYHPNRAYHENKIYHGYLDHQSRTGLNSAQPQETLKSYQTLIPKIQKLTNEDDEDESKPKNPE